MVLEHLLTGATVAVFLDARHAKHTCLAARRHRHVFFDCPEDGLDEEAPIRKISRSAKACRSDVATAGKNYYSLSPGPATEHRESETGRGTPRILHQLQHVQLDYQTYKPLVVINLALLAMALTVPAMHRFSSIAGGMVIVVSEYVALMAFTIYLGRSAGIHLQYIVAAAAPFVVFGLERLRLVTVVVILGLVLHLVAWFQFPPENPKYKWYWGKSGVENIIAICSTKGDRINLVEHNFDKSKFTNIKDYEDLSTRQIIIEANDAQEKAKSGEFEKPADKIAVDSGESRVAVKVTVK